MSKNDIKLVDNITEIRIDSGAADIIVIPDDVKETLITCSGHFNINENDGKAVIVEKTSDTTSKSTDIKFNDGSVIQSNSDISITYKNGLAVIDSFSISKEPITRNFVSVIVPKKSKDLNLLLETTTGNITVEKLILSKMIIKTLTGNVNLTDIDVLFSSIKTESGDINMEILESVLNYKLFLENVEAKVQDKITNIYPPLLNEKRELILDSLTGNINVQFKGKQFVRR